MLDGALSTYTHAKAMQSQKYLYTVQFAIKSVELFLWAKKLTNVFGQNTTTNKKITFLGEGKYIHQELAS